MSLIQAHLEKHNFKKSTNIAVFFLHFSQLRYNFLPPFFLLFEIIQHKYSIDKGRTQKLLNQFTMVIQVLN